MRQAGTLPSEQLAHRFVDYLAVQGIEARVDPSGSEFAVWVYDENRLPDCRREIETFLLNPDDPRYASVQQEANQKRRETQAAYRKAQRNLIDARQLWGSSAQLRYRPVTIFLTLASMLVAVLTNLAKIAA